VVRREFSKTEPYNLVGILGVLGGKFFFGSFFLRISRYREKTIEQEKKTPITTLNQKGNVLDYFLTLPDSCNHLIFF
jgi:hypothetical protein